MLQYVIISVIVAAAVVVAIRGVYRTLRGRKTQLNPCSSCKLREQCSHAGQHAAQCCDENNSKKCCH